MNSELAALADRLTKEYEAAEEAYRSAQAKLREVQAEIARVRDAAKLLDEGDPFAPALQKRRQQAMPKPTDATAAAPMRKPASAPAAGTPRAQAEALFLKRGE